MSSIKILFGIWSTTKSKVLLVESGSGFSSTIINIFATFKTRRKENQRDIKLDLIAQLKYKDLKKKFALVKHLCLNGHRIDWQSSTILAIESDNKKRWFLEPLCKHKTDFAFNNEITSFYPQQYKFINF